MKYLPIVFVAALGLLWGQAQYVRGFNAGADTSLCVGENILLKTPIKEIPACQNAESELHGVNGKTVLAWRKIAGDDVREIKP
ncbi:MAG: hypothetical protein A3E01_09095 [Gammaproteobacteria bacterium RIFCSPHIGHO2_12_FULL_63_22]|nr:MAG: hypothetical protein A3E01_09095 [Gammaproteobacteria bacterium RIFCSPHIGHO2_12_FULL_63_22]